MLVLTCSTFTMIGLEVLYKTEGKKEFTNPAENNREKTFSYKFYNLLNL